MHRSSSIVRQPSKEADELIGVITDQPGPLAAQVVEALPCHGTGARGAYATETYIFLLAYTPTGFECFQSASCSSL
jgi:hypothetical protein